jgi:polar amino acid transport system substrate-binding protein
VLRAAINVGNPVLARRDPSTGEPQGVSVDWATSLAQALALPLKLVVLESAGRSVATVQQGLADIGFFALDPLRSQGIDFTAPYLRITGAYLVHKESALTAVEQVDRASTRVVVGLGSAYDLYLSRELKHAQLERAPTSPAVVDQFLSSGADVAAGVRQQLEADAGRLPDLRVLPGQFMVIEQAVGLQAGRTPAALAWLRAFVDQARRSDWVEQALRRHGVEGASVARD